MAQYASEEENLCFLNYLDKCYSVICTFSFIIIVFVIIYMMRSAPLLPIPFDYRYYALISMMK